MKFNIFVPKLNLIMPKIKKQIWRKPKLIALSIFSITKGGYQGAQDGLSGDDEMPIS
jgi:hypothetical protein